MLSIFEETVASETVLHPREDPEVVRLQAALQAARELAAPASKAWGEYLAAHCDEVTRFPFPRDKQRLYDQLQDTSEVVEAAEAALTGVMDTATERATAAWNDIIRQQFVDDQPTITAFIQLLAKHEATAVEAQLAGVSHAMSVSQTFITSAEIAERLRYAKRALGLE